MTQRYTAPIALDRMRRGDCPECGMSASNHSSDFRFWIRSGCDLTPTGVDERVAQFRADFATTRES